MKKGILLIISLVVLLATSSSVGAQTHTQTFTKNGNTYIQTKTIADGKVTIETKIYDPSGNLIDTQIITKDVKTPPQKEQTIPVEKKTTTPIKNQATPTPMSENNAKQETASQATNSFIQTKYQLSVNEETGNLIVNTGSTEVELTTKPETIMEKAQVAGMDLVNEVVIDELDEGVRYLVNGTKVEKLLGLFSVPLATTLVYNPETGNLEKTEQSRWTKIADAFSY